MPLMNFVLWTIVLYYCAVFISTVNSILLQRVVVRHPVLTVLRGRARAAPAPVEETAQLLGQLHVAGHDGGWVTWQCSSHKHFHFSVSDTPTSSKF